MTNEIQPTPDAIAATARDLCINRGCEDLAAQNAAETCAEWHQERVTEYCDPCLISALLTQLAHLQQENADMRGQIVIGEENERHWRLKAKAAEQRLAEAEAKLADCEKWAESGYVRSAANDGKTVEPSKGLAHVQRERDELRTENQRLKELLERALRAALPFMDHQPSCNAHPLVGKRDVVCQCGLLKVAAQMDAALLAAQGHAERQAP